MVYEYVPSGCRQAIASALPASIRRASLRLPPTSRSARAMGIQPAGGVPEVVCRTSKVMLVLCFIPPIMAGVQAEVNDLLDAYWMPTGNQVAHRHEIVIGLLSLT